MMTRQCGTKIKLEYMIKLLSEASRTCHISAACESNRVGKQAHLCLCNSTYSPNCHWGATVVFHQLCRIAQS